MRSKTVILLAFVVIICVALAVFLISAGKAAQNTQNQAPVPAKPLTVEQKYDVLKTVGSNTVATGTAATTTTAAEKVKQEIIKNVSASSPQSTQSASEKFDVLKSLQH